MTQATSIHDFHRNAAIACTDAKLKAQLIGYLKTDALSLPEKSDLLSSTCDIITWAIIQARKSYAHDPQRLVGIVSASTDANALAVWGSTEYDWIVVSEGLMQLLYASADDMATRLTEAFPELLQSQLGQRLQATPPLKGGFQTSLGSFLYFAAISFFVGHEAGHHLAGHDGHFLSGAHAEFDDRSTAQEGPNMTTEHALELQADRVGLTICRIVTAQLLSKLWEIRTFTEHEKHEYQRVLAILLCGGAMMSAVRIKPKAIEWSDVLGRTHPPAVARVIILSMSLSRSIKANLHCLDDVSRRWIGLKCLDVAAGATIKSGSPEDQVLQERLARGGEPAAIRAVGLRKALFDPQLTAYYEQLDNHLDAIRPQLRPRYKAA